jgi:hypothetical protein
MQKPVLALLSVSALIAATGCDNRLTPDSVREYLDNPQGEVTPDSMVRATRDLFKSSGAAAAEGFAQVFKSNQGGGGASNALPVSTGVLEDVGDVFCVGGLVVDIAAFDDCDLESECHEELVLDSCLMRIGEGDEAARGRFIFKINNTVDGNDAISRLTIEMDGWENSRDEATLSTLSGRIDMETVASTTGNRSEFVFASDFESGVKRKERGFFDDGIEERVKMVAGMRLTTDSSDDSARGTLEVLAFVDEDGARTQSVAVSFEAEGHRFSAEQVTANASLSVTGSNGSFVCTWSGVRQSADRDGLTVQSTGQCVDENGETFSFEGSVSDAD